ncbi:hypothetical protein [Steroidobacter sp.]|uniref:hypothetical protein n=1 Tax=Steroidobacter sp. TaxID=1978227 RepID=UPI001A5713B2|nr:hypothetical protein [Steroidobacter sp.]MBL8269860.1 hypothetical protein [Steroidobacter sp.]
MKKTATVLNWIFLALFGLSFVVTLVKAPGTAGFGVLMPLLPFATALIAFKSAPNRALAGLGMFFNAVLVAAGGVGLYTAFTLGAKEAIFLVIASLILILPCALNFLLLKWSWDRARALKAGRQPPSESGETQPSPPPATALDPSSPEGTGR